MFPKLPRTWVMLGAVVLGPLLLGAGYIGFRMLETRSMACECDSPMDAARFGTWNPLRDRQAERAGDQVLMALQAGKCGTIPTLQDYCEREFRFRVVSWTLTGRSSDQGEVHLRYWVIRRENAGGEFGDPVWINVARQGGSWRAQSVSLYY